MINSSLDAYRSHQYSYTPETALARAQSALLNNKNPASQGPSWEGVFTIPVCDISKTSEPGYKKMYEDYRGRVETLQEYGTDSQPFWCGPICKGDGSATRRFLEAANMKYFKKIQDVCRMRPQYWWPEDDGI